MAEQAFDNPPAFPSPPEPGFAIGDPGMTLRDWFAGQALAGLLAMHWTSEWATAAEHSYELADEMLAARQNGGAL